MPERIVDHSALRTNQAFIVTLLLLAFVLDAPALMALVSAVMLLGTVFPAWGLFKAVYLYVLRPLGIVRPDPKRDNPEPHRFAQGVGGTVLVLAMLAYALQWSVVGWALSWVVVALAALNLFAGICVGCMMYYWLHRLGVPGFRVAPLDRRDASHG